MLTLATEKALSRGNVIQAKVALKDGGENIPFLYPELLLCAFLCLTVRVSVVIFHPSKDRKVTQR